MKTSRFLIGLIMVAPVLASSDEIIDLQWSICGATPEAVLARLSQEEPRRAGESRVTYYDSNPPVYTQLGLSFRTKRKNKDLLSSIKIRFDQETETSSDAICSWDRYGNQETYTCEILSSADGKDHLWNNEQMRFASRYHAVDWKNLVAFGPFKNPKWKLTIQNHPAILDSVEAGSSHLLELSVKVARADDQKTYEAVTAHLKARGVPLCARQEGKTSRLFRALGIFPE